MNYALIENGVVTNLIWLYPANESEFPGAVPMDGVPVAIGDTWDGTYFYRGGERLPADEREDMEAALRLLGVEGGA